MALRSIDVIRQPDDTRTGRRDRVSASPYPARSARKEAHMVALLLWFLGVPGLLIILLLLLGVIRV